MDFTLFGISHHQASSEIREHWLLTPERSEKVFSALKKRFQTQHSTGTPTRMIEFCSVSTCNRTEFYALTDQKEALVSEISNALELADQHLTPAYVHQNQAAVEHLFTVACGLDSMVLGEHEIMAQLKTAFNQALAQGSIGPFFHKLWQTAFSTSKSVRHQTGLNKYSMSLPGIVLRLAKNIFSDFSQLRVLFIGAGEIIRQVGKTFLDQGVKNLYFCNRSTEKIAALLTAWGKSEDTSLNIKTGELNALAHFIGEADIIITAVDQQKHLITMESLTPKTPRPLACIFDLAMPSNVDKKVSELDQVYLYSLEDISDILNDNKSQRTKVLSQTQQLIQEKVQQFMLSWKQLTGQDHIPRYRNYCHMLKDKLFVQAKQHILNGKDPIAVLEKFGHQLTNQLIHLPTENLKIIQELPE